jgi:hypothetical protein
MKILFKILGAVIIIGGSGITMLATLASLQGANTVGAVFGGGIFITLGISIFVMNKKGYSW